MGILAFNYNSKTVCMRLTRTLIAFLFTPITFSITASAQLFEDFDSGNKGSYVGASVALSTGDWFLEEALLDNITNDKCNGVQCVRMDRRDGVDTEVYMLFDKADGADEISFSIANYGSTSGNSIQVQYSTNGGSTWTNIGNVIAATATLVQHTISVEVEGNIRFKFVQGGSERLNLDDIRITDFVQAVDNANIVVTVDGIEVEDKSTSTFAKTLIGTSRQKTVLIKNTGNTQLDISAVLVEGTGFSITALSDNSLAFNESGSVTLTFKPEASGEVQGSLTVASNAKNTPLFWISLSAGGFEDGEIIPISDARSLPLGTRISVSGRVTVANEFGGPLYMQDATAGIAVFWEPLHVAAKIGDSISVTGPLTVFRPIAGNDKDFLLQISSTDDDSNVLFEVFDVPNKQVNPTPINLDQLNSGAYESQLVIIQNATINHTGAFQANTNYAVTDIFGDAELRIDNNTNLVGAIAPTEAINIVGTVGKFNGVYQLLPRFTEDLGVFATVFPGDEISMDHTLDVVTWNIEWFGDVANGPSDDAIQAENVKTLITTIDADIYALQEISNPVLFTSVIDELEGYDGLFANFTQPQRTAFIYKAETIEILNSGLLTTGMNRFDWANGRYPLFIQFNATINGETREIYAYNIHAKAFNEAPDYERRVNASRQMKTYLDAARANDNVILLGDFNDEILVSSYNSSNSPYKNFDDDPEYTIVTKSLEEAGYTSLSRFTMIDHIVFTSELEDEYFTGTERVENPFYIGSFLSKTSDHFPVWTRFQWGSITSNKDEWVETTTTIRLGQNYPNPFNPSTTISYTLNSNTEVSLDVFDLIGRKVATLVNERQSIGEHTASFDASNIASGIYIYRLVAGNQLLTRKMVLLK